MQTSLNQVTNGLSAFARKPVRIASRFLILAQCLRKGRIRKTKARPTKLTIWEIVESHPYLNSEQKKIVKESLREWIREESDKAIHICCKNYEREVSSQALMALNRGFGFGAIRLQRFVKIFNQLMDKYEEFLCGDESVGAGCYHDLKEQFPNVDEWIGDK